MTSEERLFQIERVKSIVRKRALADMPGRERRHERDAFVVNFLAACVVDMLAPAHQTFLKLNLRPMYGQ